MAFKSQACAVCRVGILRMSGKQQLQKGCLKGKLKYGNGVMVYLLLSPMKGSARIVHYYLT